MKVLRRLKPSPLALFDNKKNKPSTQPREEKKRGQRGHKKKQLEEGIPDWLLSYVTARDARFLRAEVLSAYQQMQSTQRKLVNQTRDCLQHILPHVLQKMNRVHYGLLQPEDMQHVSGEQPQSRSVYT